MSYNEQTIRDLFHSWAQAPAETVTALTAAGSDRCYFRVSGGGKQAVAAYNANKLENKAFFAIGRHAQQEGVNVPAIYAIAEDELHYLQEDLGDTSLFSLLGSGDELLLKKTLEALAFMQVKGLQGFDYTQCYPVESFDRQSIFWDFNYFKYNFLKFIKIDVDEVRLEEDFNRFADYLLTADPAFFMYRDFQSRNVMIHEGKPYFIDFQGGRRGPLAYDLASFLFQVRANFSEQTKEILLQHYLNALEKLTSVNRSTFIEQLYAFAFFKGLQNLGTYGYRGLFEQKAMFAQSIPQAVHNLCALIDSGKLNHLSADYLFEVIQGYKLRVTSYELQGEDWRRLEKVGENGFSPIFTNFHQFSPISTLHPSPFTLHPLPLTVTVTSFSYKNGYPHDDSGNGGGFVFDCRGLNNPGRIPEFYDLNGRDREVINFLEKETTVSAFLQAVFAALDISVSNYIERGFTRLSVAFGCTGGQHRSVYCAEQTAKYLFEKYRVKVHLLHREQRIEQHFTPQP